MQRWVFIFIIAWIKFEFLSIYHKAEIIMALQMNYYYQELDMTIMNAYWRINPTDGLMGGKNRIHYNIDVFKNSDLAHVDNPRPIATQSYSFIPVLSDNSLNFIAQAYNHAKSLPYFSGSVDV